jgi:hypothetical protein
MLGSTLAIRLSHNIGKEDRKRKFKSSNAPTQIKADNIADKNYAI